jgi:hypothetical protein
MQVDLNESLKKNSALCEILPSLDKSRGHAVNMTWCPGRVLLARRRQARPSHFMKPNSGGKEMDVLTLLSISTFYLSIWFALILTDSTSL